MVDLDFMVGEVEVHFRNIHFGHVARGAGFGGLRAGLSRMVGCGFWARWRNVAAQANMVVCFRVVTHLLVRIMASHAGEPSVSFTPAFAHYQTIGLYASITDSSHV